MYLMLCNKNMRRLFSRSAESYIYIYIYVVVLLFKDIMKKLILLFSLLIELRHMASEQHFAS